jgi:opacity protein-like surface antigen
MSHSRLSFGLALIASVAAGTSLFSGATSAADLDSSFLPDMPSLPMQQVTFGSGWYIRGDIAATEGYQFGVFQPPRSTIIYGDLSRSSKANYDLSLGGGYAFTNSVRGDITADFHQPVVGTQNPTYCYNSASQTCSASGRFASYDALANVYYDFGPFGVLTPYVGAGVGVAFGTLNTTLLGGSEAYGSHLSYHNVAWALMAGVSLDVYAHTKLDIGYRYLDNGTTFGTHLRYNEIRAGLRYMIDN